MLIIVITGVLDPENYKADTPISDLGLDSLMSTEILQVLGRKYNVNLRLGDLTGLTIDKLRQL